MRRRAPHASPALSARRPRRRRVLVRVALAAALLAAATANAGREPASPWRPGRPLRQALDHAATAIRHVIEGSSYGLDDAGACWTGTYLLQGRSTSLTVTLHAGTPYVFLAAGDDDVARLELGLADSNGVVVARDSTGGVHPTLGFTPRSDGEYALVTRLPAARAPGSFVILARLREGGFDVPQQNLASASAALVRACERADAALGGVTLRDGDDEVFLYGVLLEPGRTFTPPAVALARRAYAFVAADDDASGAAALAVSDSSGAVVARTRAGDAPPARLAAGGTVSLRITDPKAKDVSLAMAAILKPKHP